MTGYGKLEKTSHDDSFNFRSVAGSWLFRTLAAICEANSLISSEAFEGPEHTRTVLLFQVSQGGWQLNVGCLSPAEKILRRAEAFSIRGMLTAILKQSLTPDQAWGPKSEQRSGATGNVGG